MPEGDLKEPGQSPIPETGTKIPIAYDGAAGPVARIAATNAALSIVTLGFYRFWGKTRLRRYFWSHVTVGGDRLEYTGLAKELLIGFLIAVAVLAPLIAIDAGLQSVLDPESPLLVVEQLLFALVLWFLINFAIFRARRYRMTRTSWRGIRFRQTGQAVRYALMAMTWQFLSGLTLGLLYPFYRMSVQEFIITNTWFGNERLRFTGRGSELFSRWLIAWLLLIPTLGVSYVWYWAQEFNYSAWHTSMTGLRVESDLSTGRVMKIIFIFLLCMLALLVVLVALLVGLASGFSMSFAQGQEGSIDVMTFSIWHWSITALVVFVLFFRGTLLAVFWLHPILRAICECLTFYGGRDLEKVLQEAASGITYGEGLADALDVGDF